MLRCRDIVELLAEYLDGELEPATAQALEAHLAGCRECTAFMKHLRELLVSLGTFCHQTTSPFSPA